MASSKKIRVAIVGLGFGAEFIPIYQNHPNAEMYALCRRNEKGLNECGDKFGVKVRYTDFNKLLQDPNVDAVHINSPIPDHAPQSLAALKAGKHVACTVPMATSVEECKALVEAQRKSGKVYMMMETVVYSREYLFVKEQYDKGELGRVQFLRGSHQQDMDGWPDYWPGLPPMHYATHCVSPCLALLGKHAESVVCHGSGRIREDLIGRYGSPFALETATFKIKDSDVVAEVTSPAARKVSSGSSWKTSSPLSTPRASLSRRFPSASRCRTTGSCCLSRSANSPAPFKTRTICRSSRGQATAARIRI
jgi:predicted dehydrogenase